MIQKIPPSAAVSMILLSLWMTGPPLQAQVPATGAVRVRYDFVDHFKHARVTQASDSSASLQQRSGRVARPGIFLHPRSRGTAMALYGDVEVPKSASQDNCWLVFDLGMRDDIPWESKRPNGVRFGVAIDGERVFSEEHRGVGWQGRAVNLRRWAGREVSVAFLTEAIDGNSSYDWSVFGQPLLLEIVGAGERVSLSKTESRPGLVLVECECGTPATIEVQSGDHRQRVKVGPGRRVVAVRLPLLADVKVAVARGQAVVQAARAAPFDADLKIEQLSLSSPLVHVGRPFSVLVRVRNAGLGAADPFTKIPVTVAMTGTASRRRDVQVRELAPGAERFLVWRDLQAPEPGPGSVKVDGGPVLDFHAFQARPSLPSDRPKESRVVVHNEGRLRALIEHRWCRLALVVDDGHAYGIAEVWNGSSWQRAAALYPLSEIVVKKNFVAPHTVAIPRVTLVEKKDRELLIRAQHRQGGKAWRVETRLRPAPSGPRIEIISDLRGDDAIYRFSGPRVLAGDGSYGVRKDFAVFPGLEYLERGEPSSSTRDLVYPLSDRRVPAVHKIAAPLMAVQGASSLVALMWPPRVEWKPGEQHLAARFEVPGDTSGLEHIHLSLSVPPVGSLRAENSYVATRPVRLQPGEVARIPAVLVLDHEARYPADSIAKGPHGGGLVLQAFRHWFDAYGLPSPSPQPRPWKAEKELSRGAYFTSLWREDPPGWSHCVGWPQGLYTGHALPLLLDTRDHAAPEVRREIERRVSRIVDAKVRAHGPGSLWRQSGCHIHVGELPFFLGHTAASLKEMRNAARDMLRRRENGLWVWRNTNPKHAELGKQGDHTLGTAARNVMVVLRAARLTGDATLARDGLKALEQTYRYDVPRGAQMWECPLYQPDILAAAYAIRAFCEAYRITGEAEYLMRARYWAWTGLNFLYLWEMEGYPTMRYNVISVIGSTFFRHSWLGLPVVWCGLVYGYALQDLALFDDSLDWRRIAQGVVNSAMWQQYTSGKSKGCYPDSWHMIENAPRPADINPENILLNEFRLRGRSPMIQFRRLAGKAPAPAVMINSSARIATVDGTVETGSLRIHLRGDVGFPEHTVVAPVPRPKTVTGLGEAVADEAQLFSEANGWVYDSELRAVVLKSTATEVGERWEVGW